MITLKHHIKSLSDAEFILHKQLNYSYAFRKLYHNIDKLKDVEYLKIIKDEYHLNDIELRSIISEVKTKFKQTKTNKEQLEADIVSLESDIKKVELLPKSKKNIRLLHKLKNKLNYKNKTLSKDIVFGSKKLLKRLSYLNNDKLLNKNAITETKKQYSDNRILPIFILGEANRYGNRFIKFDLLNNKITYKPQRGVKIDIEFSCYKSHKDKLIKLQSAIDNKEIAVSIMLSTDYVYLIYDDEVLNGYAINTVERTKEVKKINDIHIDKETKTQLIKDVYKKYYDIQKEKKLKDKLNYRYLAIDTNPDYIGCSIIDKVNDNDINIVHTFNYDLRELNSKENHKLNNKRIHGICHVWKDIFEVASYYNCGYIVLEELNFKGDDIGNTEGNRKTKNLWYRELSANLITKYCNKLGIIKLEINPCYTSFIGNMQYEYIDPINASIEIGRRGIFKYNKGKFYPEFDTGTIVNAMSKLNELRDVSSIKDCESWVEMYREVRQSGLRFRATYDDTAMNHQVVFNIIHSKIRKDIFRPNNIGKMLDISYKFIKLCV